MSLSGVVTDIENGKLTTDLDANSKQIVGPNLVFSNSISPTTITANQNDYNPTGLSGASRIRLTSDTNRTITGIAGGVDGAIKIFENANATSGDITFSSQSVSSSAANRLQLPHDMVMKAPGGRIVFEYDGTRQRWWSDSNHTHTVGDVSGAEATANKGAASGYPGLDSTVTLVVNQNVSATTPVTGAVFQFAAADAVQAMGVIDSYGALSNFVGRRSGGTAASKTALLLNSNIVGLAAQGHDGVGYSANSGILLFSASENWGATAHGTVCRIFTTANTTTTSREVARVHPSGSVSIGSTVVTTDPGAGNLLLSGNLLQGVGTGVPASAGATGVAGTFAFDTGFLYVCTATNTWKRVAIATW